MPRRIRFVDRLGSPAWVLITGVLLGLSVPPSPLYGLAWIALVPLLARWIQRPSPWMLFRETFAAFLIVSTLGGYWVLLHADALKALLAGLGLLVLPLPFAAAVTLSSALSRRLGLAIGGVALVAGWLTAEFALSRGMLAAPWLILGHTQANALPFNQIADLGGAGGLTLWVWVVNLSAFLLLRARGITPKFATGLGLALVVLLPMGYRGWQQAQTIPPTDFVRVTVVQPALSASQWAEVASTERVRQLADLSDGALQPSITEARTGDGSTPDLIIWPEAALPVFPDARLQHVFYERISDWTTRRNVPLLTGAVTRFDTAPALTVEPVIARQVAARYPYYNSALLFDGRLPTQQYDKVIQVPAVDRVPTVGIELGEVLGVTRGYGAGALGKGFTARGARFGTIIGYEVWFGDHSRRMVAEGATFLTALSDPSWWGYSPAVSQHDAITRLRAVETRRAVVSASVTGGSGVVFPDGSRGEAASWMERRTVTTSVPMGQVLTPYVRYGDIVYRLALGLQLLVVLAWAGAVAFFPVKAESAG